MTDVHGTITYTAAYSPYGERLGSQGAAATPYGFTGEWEDPSDLVYLRARYYSSAQGRFTSRDTWGGNYQQPLTGNRWNYVHGNPINFIDPSGHIEEREDNTANNILISLRNNYGITIVKDWGNTLIRLPGVNLPDGGCVWRPGRWNLLELRIVLFAAARMNQAMNGNMRTLVGPSRIAKVPLTQCERNGIIYRACTPTGQNLVELRDFGRLPSNSTMSANTYNNAINFDAWTVVHELAHVWNNTLGGQYAIGLEQYTRRMTFGQDPRPEACDPLGVLPSCNQSGYVYHGIPATGSGSRFNPSEDFSESVAAYVFPEVLEEKKYNLGLELASRLRAYQSPLSGETLSIQEQNYWRERYDLLLNLGYQANFENTLRWHYVNGVINGAIDPYNP